MITLIDIDKYRDKRLASYSLLSALDKGNLNYVRDYIKGDPLDDYEKKRSKARDIGSYVDALLFYPTSYVEDNFYVLSSNYSEGLYTKFIDIIVKAICTDDSLKQDIPEDETKIEEFFITLHTHRPNIMTDAFIETGFKLSFPAVFAKIKKEYLQFMLEKLKAFGKTTLTINEAMISDSTVEALKGGVYTGRYFMQDSIEVKHLTQVPFSFKYQLSTTPNPVGFIPTMIVKVLPDIIEIDHVLKEIRGVDVKTKEGSAYYFKYDFLRWRYYLQSALYTRALASWLEFKQDNGKYKDYTLNNQFRFVIGSTDIFNSCIFECTEQDIELGLTGFNKSDGTHVKGVYQLLNDLHWHNSNDYWVTPRDIFKSDGVQQLNLLNKL